ncbi:MAG: ACT domain-containing protein [Clostridiales bacterium]|jgi:chorismate mutase|nr:ACT domain-containing protein [Clostridiales bacterium]
MGNKFFVVERSILPNYCEKVIEVKRHLEDGSAKDVSAAVKMVGISRSTYYKYKDFVKEMRTVVTNRHAMVSLMMVHETGMLKKVLEIISSFGYSIWTINQNPPVDGVANLIITLDLDDKVDSIGDMLQEISDIEGLSNVQLLGIN